MRYARVVNPRPSVAFGVRKSRDPQCTGFPSRPTGLGGSGSWGGHVFCIVTLDVTLETIELKFPSRVEAVGEAAAAVSQYMNRLGIAEDVAFGIDMAVREAVTNAVVHGNKLDNAKFIEVTLRQTPEGFEIRVHDQGLGFNPNDVPDPTKDENLLKTSGRGIFFMRNFMDQVEWSPGSKGGTDVRMLKKL